MVASEAAYDEVERLVNRFKALSTAERRSYNEAATRQAFVLPLFSALEWNIDNAAEVSPEEKVSRGWVDYSFRLGGIPRFFLETKKIAEDLTDPRWVKQAIDYAWSKSVTWALLSDFEGLRLFNAEWKEDNPLRAQFVEFGVDTYLSDFERLWWLSRPETLAGTLDREAEKVGKKARRQPVSQHLFDDLKSWRHDLFTHLRAYNSRRSPAQIDEAVLRILNRLIFIRAAEDRIVEEPRLQPLLRDLRERGKTGQLLNELKKLFREFDAIYDSELFARHFSDELDSESKPFETLIEGLYGKSYILYNFNAIDADVLGTAYEQYLGHVIADPDAAEVVEKRAKRKSQGIYYTPTFVVKYIVQQTLGRYLEEHAYTPSRPVRVLDMACGSGSFLIEAFDVLDRHVAQMRGQNLTPGPSPDDISRQARGVRDGYDEIHDYARRMEILTQCIYGVDKDEQAVAVARLNLLLKALHAREKLPMLENIRVGDSLIFGAPDELQAAFGPDWKEKKPFNWETEFGEVMRGGGFDVIVGNPPYIRAENMPREERDYYMSGQKFEVVYGRFDIHILFVERAIKLLKEGGRLGLIIPYSALNQSYAKLLRKLILESCAIESIVDLSEYKVFQEAAVSTCIVVLRKEVDQDVRNDNEFRLVRQNDFSEGISETSRLKIRQNLYQATVDHMFRLELTGVSANIANAMERKSIPLGQICYAITGVVAHDSTTGASKDRLIHNRKTGKRPKPYIEAKETSGRYAPLLPKRYIEYRPDEMHRPKFPELFESPKILIPDIIGTGGLSAIIDYQRIYTNHSFNCCVLKKDLVRVKRNLGISEQDAELSAKFDLRFLLGIINSRLMTFYFRTNLGGGLHASPANVRRLPIPLVNFGDPTEKAQHDAIVALVGEMLQLQKDYAEAERNLEDRRHALKRRIEQVDAEIDRMVYQLYGLTEEEIALVEG